ncbi:DUF6975 family protein [Sphingomonas qilianensis]|uniref:Uncharacterized protein n=1 Tax=Sphingomonas qilianensis TaxID=1736690 RepID=A0ABU9XNU2_9SPHN
MAQDLTTLARCQGNWGLIAALADADGTSRHPMPTRLAARDAAVRDLSDAIHAWCWLHGRQPGLIEYAIQTNAQPLAQEWLIEAAAGFAAERSYLARLVAAAGHQPSTPGQAESEAAVLGQRHALDMLAQSERTGCATGAAIALVIDWAAIRVPLDAAARRFGVEPAPFPLPLDSEIETVVLSLGQSPAIERAMAFGAQQLLAQHRGLWTLIEARASARDAL